MESFVIDGDGQSLAACQFMPEGPLEYVLIICHGFRGAKENSGKLAAFAQRLNQIGCGALAFDFSGSGASEGDFKDITLSRQATDLKRVIDYASASFSVPIMLLGRSFGGSTVLAAGTADIRVAGYILWSTPIHLHETFSAIMNEAYQELLSGKTVGVSDEAGSFMLGPDLIEDFNRHDMNEYLRQIGDRPVLIIHGENDEVVAPANARSICEGLSNARLYLVPGADHRFNGKTREREDITLQWLESFNLKNEQLTEKTK